MSAFRDRVELALRAKSLTKAALARAIGLSKQRLHQILSGDRPGTERVPDIAQALDVPVEWLTTGAQSPAWAQTASLAVGRVREDGSPYAVEEQAAAVLDLVGTVVAGDGDLSAYEQPTEPEPFPIPDHWAVVEVQGMSAYPVVYPGQFAAIDLDRSAAPPFDDEQIEDLHDNLVLIQTIDGRALLKRWCRDWNSPQRFLLASIDAGRSSPWVSVKEILIVSPVVGVFFYDPRQPRQKRYHAKTVVVGVQ